MRVFENTSFPFIQNRKVGYIVSSVLIIASIASLVIRGLELGIDFQGGMEFVVESSETLPVPAVREALGELAGSRARGKDLWGRCAAHSHVLHRRNYRGANADHRANGPGVSECFTHCDQDGYRRAQIC